MDNLRSSIEILFCRVNPNEVICKWLNNSFDDYSEKLPQKEFIGRLEALNRLQNRDELNAIYHILNELWASAPETVLSDDNKGEGNCFYTLLTFARKVLYEKSEKPVCIHSQLLRWREISLQTGEDIFTTSYIAYKDIVCLRDRHYFSWSPTISTDNHALDCVLNNGVTDLHFHLYGSSQHFDIGWLSLMNDIRHRQSDFNKLYSHRYPYTDINPQSHHTPSLYSLCVKACAIRQFLFLILSKKIERKKDAEELNNILTKYKGILVCDSDEDLGLFIDDLQKENERLKYLYGRRYGKSVIDYAIKKSFSDKNEEPESQHNTFLYGERWIMYKMFHSIFSNDDERSYYKPLFYAYLLIKIKIRQELIQVNGYYGFGNFQEYQDRKTVFIRKNTIYEKIFVNWAIRNSIINQNVRYLEVRIKPSSSIKSMKKELQTIDLYANQTQGFEGEYLSKISDNFYYVFHFIKRPDRKGYTLEKGNGETGYFFGLRDKQLRRIVKNQAIAINQIRQQYGILKERIVGIDAASSEIGCRPEVFAQAYRYIKKFSKEIKYPFLENSTLSHLGYTYHVGEDFLDIADGLRAIDEAIIFLNLRSGDRLGHCLALGISPEKYYNNKGYHVILSKQDLLDNIVWILTRIKEYDIICPQSLLLELNQKFQELYSDIYGSVEIPEGFDTVFCKQYQLPYELYYSSWLLRGDDPQWYYDLYKEPQAAQAPTLWDMCGLNRFNIVEEQLAQARKNTWVRWLYNKYHFSESVRQNGSIHTEFKISKNYVSLIRAIQNKMMFEIAKKHIAIETNPTSNKLIGSFNRYDEHPLPRFFNLGLTYDHTITDNCPQLSVSINTDDLGVFSTSISNEYALIAAALEKKKKDDGTAQYNTRMVYDWLEYIRKMGFEQQFRKKSNNHNG